MERMKPSAAALPPPLRASAKPTFDSYFGAASAALGRERETSVRTPCHVWSWGLRGRLLGRGSWGS